MKDAPPTVRSVEIPQRNKQVILTRYPVGVPETDCFDVVDAPVPEAQDGQLLVETGDLSLDPYLRTAIMGTHLDEAQTPLGSLMPGRSVARVLTSTHEGPPVGSFVVAPTGWQQLAVVDPEEVTRVHQAEGVPPSAALGALGMPGLTAYAAIMRQLRPRVGETVVVSSATGGVGSVAGQLARLAGARTVAIVGSESKAEMATDVFGYDHAVIRTDGNWRENLEAFAPEGVDCYLHSGDSEILEGVLRRLSIGGRVTLCGLMDQYNDEGPSMMPAGAVIAARAVVHGIVVYDHVDLIDEQLSRIGNLLASGRMRMMEDRTVGLENAPEAFVRLMAGQNIGKAIVQVASISS